MSRKKICIVSNSVGFIDFANMKNSLNLDLTSTINTDEIYNSCYNEPSSFNFSITRVDSGCDSGCDSDNYSYDSCLNNSLIK